MKSVIISKYNKGQEIMIFQLIKKVYDEFVSHDYSEEGNRFFYDWIDPYKIAKRQLSERSILIASDDEVIVGMIEIRDNNRISLLFVDKEYQGRGIARKLFQESLKKCFQNDPELKMFYVHASPYSIPVYRKLGFIETDEMQETMGIKYLPMEMKIYKQDISL